MNRNYPPSKAEIENNKAKMAALVARCAGGKVRPIVAPPGVMNLGECPEAVKKAKKRPYRLRSTRSPRLGLRSISEEQAQTMYAEYMRSGETLTTVARRHGTSPASLSVRFRELGLGCKSSRGPGHKGGAPQKLTNTRTRP